MMTTVTAQELYDWRERTALVSGTDLAMLFDEILGEPSPRGRALIAIGAIEKVRDENIGFEIGAVAAAVLATLAV